MAQQQEVSNVKEGVEGLTAGSIPGMFSQTDFQSALAVTDVKNRPEAWSLQPTTNPGLNEQGESAFNEALSASRFHQHSRRIRLELQEELVPSFLLEEEKQPVFPTLLVDDETHFIDETHLKEYEAAPITAIEFEIPIDQPSVDFNVSPGGGENSEVISSLRLPDAQVTFANVTCFHKASAPVSKDEQAGIRLTKEPMTIISDILSCKKLFDYVESQRTKDQHIENISTKPDNRLTSPFNVTRLESGADTYDVDMFLVRADKSGNHHPYRRRVIYNPSQKPVSRSGAEESAPEVLDGISFIVSPEEHNKEG
ncbi:hypothetical protein I350_04993 [Cryptococcus amylolentus CBS 6273]|uniref:Uncharacterized protein n=1 Tax=Cryptococcus amylolentus CBS 6273 TaxID=1296118 RepID=A0A1E3K177_9TREE|nr:hypothetical protein I350_04993 [Cryptococcus amylolentus CBS 6273]